MPLSEATKEHLFNHDGADVSGCESCEVRPLLKLIHQAWFYGGRVDSSIVKTIWSLQDGYGEPGFTPEQGMDWSGIRDSSPGAIKAIAEALGFEA